MLYAPDAVYILKQSNGYLQSAMLLAPNTISCYHSISEITSLIVLNNKPTAPSIS